MPTPSPTVDRSPAARRRRRTSQRTSRLSASKTRLVEPPDRHPLLNVSTPSTLSPSIIPRRQVLSLRTLLDPTTRSQTPSTTPPSDRTTSTALDLITTTPRHIPRPRRRSPIEQKRLTRAAHPHRPSRPSPSTRVLARRRRMLSVVAERRTWQSSRGGIVRHRERMDCLRTREGENPRVFPLPLRRSRLSVLVSYQSLGDEDMLTRSHRSRRSRCRREQPATSSSRPSRVNLHQPARLRVSSAVAPVAPPRRRSVACPLVSIPARRSTVLPVVRSQRARSRDLSWQATPRRPRTVALEEHVVRERSSNAEADELPSHRRAGVWDVQSRRWDRLRSGAREAGCDAVSMRVRRRRSTRWIGYISLVDVVRFSYCNVAGTPARFELSSIPRPPSSSSVTRPTLNGRLSSAM